MPQVLDELDVPAPVNPLPSDVPEGQHFTGDDRQPIPREARRLQHILGVPGHVFVAVSRLSNIRVTGKELALHLAEKWVSSQVVTGLLDDAVELVCFGDG